MSTKTTGRNVKGKCFEKPSETSSQRLLLDNKMLFNEVMFKFIQLFYSRLSGASLKGVRKQREKNMKKGKICQDSTNQTTTGQSKPRKSCHFITSQSTKENSKTYLSVNISLMICTFHSNRWITEESKISSKIILEIMPYDCMTLSPL